MIFYQFEYTEVFDNLSGVMKKLAINFILAVKWQHNKFTKSDPAHKARHSD